MRIGVDVGGTKIEAIALGTRGEELLRRRVPTPAGDYGATVRTICDLVLGMERELDEAGTVGLGTPGAISPASGLIKNSNSLCLIGRPFDRDLAEALRRPVRVANDANCFALSEAVDGAAAGAAVVFGVILGTGVGGGIVVNQHVLTGRNAIAGEWGHNPLPRPRDDERPGPPCYCGRSGCIERFLSGPALERDFHARTGRSESAARIAELDDAGDRHADAVLARYEDRLARSLAMVINLLDPDAIVLGGGVSNIDRLYRNVPALWSREVFSDCVETRLVKARHGDSSGVRGAAWLWE